MEKEVEENDLLETHRIGHGGHKVEAGESFSEIASCSFQGVTIGIGIDTCPIQSFSEELRPIRF